MPIWNKEAECASSEARQKLQLDRLQKTVERVYSRVPFYRERLDRAGVNPNSITSLKDIARLPFTSKVETIEQTRDKGLGITVHVGTRRGHASTSDFSAAAKLAQPVEPGPDPCSIATTGQCVRPGAESV